MQDIRTNLERVRERVARAAERAGRRPDDVLIVGVSKTVDVARVRAAIAAGLGALGENRVQEARDKIAEVGRGYNHDTLDDFYAAIGYGAISAQPSRRQVRTGIREATAMSGSPSAANSS